MQIFPDTNQLDHIGSHDADYMLESQSVQSHSQSQTKTGTNKKKKSPKGKSKKVTPMKIQVPSGNEAGNTRNTVTTGTSQTQPITPNNQYEGAQSLENTMTHPPLSTNNQGSLHETPKSARNQSITKALHQLDSESQKRLDQKIQELEFEIQRFKQEKQKVQNLQQEYEEQLERVTREIEDFESRKELEVEEIQQWKDEQMREIEQERLKIENEKMEVAQYRQEILREKERYESQQSEESERVRYQISCLERDNYELQEKLAEFTNKDLYEIGINMFKTVYIQACKLMKSRLMRLKLTLQQQAIFKSQSRLKLKLLAQLEASLKIQQPALDKRKLNFCKSRHKLSNITSF